MTGITISIRTDKALLAIESTRKRVENAISPESPLPKLIWKEMQLRVDSIFQQNRRGGLWRGAAWNYFKDQYTRKTDGVTVPAWGGVPHIGQYSAISDARRAKLKAAGLNFGSLTKNKNKTVLGRLRPSGARVTPLSSIMQDTGELRRGAASVLQVFQGRMAIKADSRVGVRAAALSRQRPFLFWYLPDDELMIHSHYESYIRGDYAGGT